MSDDLVLVVLVLLALCALIGAFLGVLHAPAYKSHADINRIHRPLKPADPADIERRDTNVN